MNEQTHVPVVATVTAPDRPSAERLARRLVEAGLAACVQLIDPIRSIYRWQGRVEEASEVLLVLKSDASRLERIAGLLDREHPYEVPELVATAVTGGHAGYLRWLAGSLD